MPTWSRITPTSQQRITFFFIERSYPHVWNWTTTEISGNINPDNAGILGTLISLLLFSLSLVRAGQVLLGKTDEAWEGGAEAQLTLPLPSPPFPCAPSISTPTPPHPVPSSPLPVSLALLNRISSSTELQSAKPNVLPGAGNHLHHRLHQSASEVWRAHCAGVRNELQMLIIASKPYSCEWNLIFLLSYSQWHSNKKTLKCVDGKNMTTDK